MTKVKIEGISAKNVDAIVSVVQGSDVHTSIEGGTFEEVRVIYEEREKSDVKRSLGFPENISNMDAVHFLQAVKEAQGDPAQKIETAKKHGFFDWASLGVKSGLFVEEVIKLIHTNGLEHVITILST